MKNLFLTGALLISTLFFAQISPSSISKKAKKATKEEVKATKSTATKKVTDKKEAVKKEAQTTVDNAKNQASKKVETTTENGSTALGKNKIVQKVNKAAEKAETTSAIIPGGAAKKVGTAAGQIKNITK